MTWRASLVLVLLLSCGESPQLVVSWDPTPLEARLPGVVEALRVRDPQAALAELDRLAAAGELPEGALHFRGLALSDLGRRDEAMAAWARELEEHPGNGRAHALLARQLIDAGRLDEAEAHLIEAQRHAPGFPQVLLLSGRLALLRDEDERAQRFLRDYLLLDPHGVHAAEAHHGLSQVAARRGDPSASFHQDRARQIEQVHGYLASFEQRLRDDPEDLEAAYGVAAAYLNLYMNVSPDVELLEQAEPALRYIVERRPEHAKALYNLGFVAVERRRFDEALELFRRSVSADPEYAPARINLGTLLARLEQREQARAELEQVLLVAEAPHDRARAHLELAHLLERSEVAEDWTAAIGHYQAVLEAFPDDELAVRPRIERLQARLDPERPAPEGEAPR
jgi:tetratricopeptide (TPR) repeat protein